MEKPCVRCHAVKPLSDFHSDHRSSDGRASACKTCVYAQRAAKQAQEAPEQREFRLARQRFYTKRYRNTPHGRKAVRRSQKVATAKQKRVADMSEAERNQRRARVAVSNARSHGMRLPPACERCGAAAPVHAHHWHGYEPKHWLDVLWLCHSCHGGAHREARI